MIKLYKIKFIKDTELKKTGEIGDATKKNADSFVKNGYAEYIKEPKKKKDIKKKQKLKKEDKPLMPLKQVGVELQKAIDMKPLKEEDFLSNLCKTSGRKLGGLRNQLKLYRKEIKEEKKKEEIRNYSKEEQEDIQEEVVVSTPTDILKEESNIEELENYKEGEINWLEDEYYDDWKKIKGHTKNLWNSGSEYTGSPPEWFFLAHSKDTIIGRPQLIENVQKRIPLVRCAVKKEKEGKDDEGTDIQSFYFFDEKFDKRYNGSQVDAFALDFLMYRVISEDLKEYYLMSREELPNQVCTFSGMLVELDDFAEMSRSMKISSLSRIFFVKDYESSIKVLTPEQIVSYTKNREITEKDWLDFLAYHEIGTSNRFPLESEMLRSSHLLSSKVDKIPQHLGIIGPAGTRKSMGYIETIAHKFSEAPHIVEGACSRIKGLTPSFAVKPANLGYLAKCERIGFIDELGKMVEAESVKHQSNTKNILGELNALLDNKVREVSSGNDNTCSVQANAKFIFVMNPISGLPTLGTHVGLIDPTTMSRIFWWVQDYDEQKFVISGDGVTKSPPTSSQAQSKGITTLGQGGNTKNSYVLGKGWGRIDNREEFLTLFDTCNNFLCCINDEKILKLSTTITQLAREPMKSVWKPRGEHHVKLLVDGLTKHRCLFKDYDETFEANKEDYDMAERILIRMVKGWDTNLSIKKEWSQ